LQSKQWLRSVIFNMIKQKAKNNNGFTLVETMFAVFILSSTIVGLMVVVSNSLFAARYARDEITVNYLLQEAIDHIRNDRDTIVFFESDGTWDNFVNKYTSVCSGTGGGCSLNALSQEEPKPCPYGLGCPYLYYDKNAENGSFYVTDNGISMGDKIKTNFRRKILVEQNAVNPDEVDVTVTIDWKNGSLPVTRALKTSFMKWMQ
jgi:type II secretory pathway pseudopilin PulG